MKCSICGKEVLPRGLKYHLTTVHGISDEEYYIKYMMKDSENICKMFGKFDFCKKETKFISLSKGFNTYCSSKCMANDPDIKEKKKNTYIKNYGVDNPAKNSEIVEKIKDTCVKLYGKPNFLQTAKGKEKLKKSVIKKYNCNNISKLQDIKEKKKKTCLKNHGVDNPAKSYTIRRKMRNTCYENYGAKNPQHTKKVKLQNFNDLKKNHPFLFIVEEIKCTDFGDPIGHCKNHNCLNSKEKGGWFKLTYAQISNRITNLEKGDGNGDNFYCSEECKQDCPLYALKTDPFQNIKKVYTSTEYQTFREHVLKRDNYKCQYCGEKAEHVHHERPQKLEPFFALDPDYAWSCCEKCHYEKGHKDECSTAILSQIYCSN